MQLERDLEEALKAAGRPPVIPRDTSVVSAAAVTPRSDAALIPPPVVRKRQPLHDLSTENLSDVSADSDLSSPELSPGECRQTHTAHNCRFANLFTVPSGPHTSCVLVVDFAVMQVEVCLSVRKENRPISLKKVLARNYCVPKVSRFCAINATVVDGMFCITMVLGCYSPIHSRGTTLSFGKIVILVYTAARAATWKRIRCCNNKEIVFLRLR